MPDPTNPGIVVPATQTVPAAVAGAAPTATATITNGLGSGWAKIVTNMTAVGAIMLFAYLMLTQILDSARTAQDLLRDGQKEQGDKLGSMVDELREVKRSGRENNKVMKESADSLKKIADELTKTLPSAPSKGEPED